MNERSFRVDSMLAIKQRFRAAYDLAEKMLQEGKEIEIKIVERKSKRSIEQNKRYWAMLREISAVYWVDKKQFSDQVWHEYFSGQFIGFNEIVLPGGEKRNQSISTTTLNVAEFGDYMTRIESYCASEGFEVAA